MPTVSNGLYKWLVGRGATLEDFADRLNHFWTFGLLLLFACIVSWKQGYEKPINCWMPAQFTNAHVRYTEQKCWNSYFITYPQDRIEADDKIREMFNISSASIPIFSDLQGPPFVASDPVNEDDDLLTRMSTTRTIYQWFPIILCFQALLFKLPNLVMYISHSYSGMAFEKVAGLTKGYQNMNIQERGVISRQIARYMYNWCLQFKNFIPCRLLTLIWLVVKVLYLVNVIVQMFLVDSLLKTTNPPLDNFTSYGDVIGGNLLNNNASLWKFSPAFPRQIFCDFEIRMLTNTQRWTVQCDLTINYFNEFIYMFLWVWLLIVTLVTCLSLVMWTLQVTIPIFRTRYIKRVITVAEDTSLETIPCDGFDRFCNIVGEDGVMVLKLISANSSDFLVANVVSDMFGLYKVNAGDQTTGRVLSVPEVQVHPTASIESRYPDEPK